MADEAGWGVGTPGGGADWSDEEVLATGVWCKNCNFFEDHDGIEWDGERCLGCGCSRDDHKDVVVRAA